jgi:hypothetical protein
MNKTESPEKPDEMPDFPNDLVTIARFYYLYEAELLAAKLEAEGIEAFIPDAMTISMDPFLANTIGGIRVQIRQADAQQARTVLAVVQQNNTPQPTKPEFVTHNGKKMRLNKGVCMECDAAGIYITVQPLWRSILSGVVALGVDLPFSPPRICWCSECNAEWKL